MALEAPEIMETLELETIVDRTWNIQACSAVSQQGLNEGMRWLINEINKKEPVTGAATVNTDAAAQ